MVEDVILATSLVDARGRAVDLDFKFGMDKWYDDSVDSNVYNKSFYSK